MHRLLIVDDERHIVDWLYELFMDKSGLDVDVVKAYSGKEALLRLEASKIDVVLSDIRMPGMSGLELMERIKGSWPGCKIVFLTGYDEFEYIYSAAKQSGVSYLLKTEDDDAIVEAVGRAISELERELADLQLRSRALEKEELVAHLMRKELLLDAIDGKARLGDADRGWLDKLSISLDEKKPVLLLLGRLHDVAKGQDYTERFLCIRGLSALSAQYLSPLANHALIDLDKYDLMWLLQPAERIGESSVPPGSVGSPWRRTAHFAKGMLETLQTASEEALETRISFLLYDEPVVWPSIREKQDLLKAIADVRFPSPRSMPVVCSIGAQEASELAAAAKAAVDGSPSSRKADEFNFREDELIERIKAYVRGNLDGELTLVRISEKVNYNPSYVSRFFKQATGTNLFDFIHKARIGKAKELLEEGSRPIQDIARAAGFDSPQYFATAFKKATGMTPNEYRNQLV